MRRSALLFALASLLHGGCDGGCLDQDADRYGLGCAMGPDCDDRNAARNTDCERVPPPDCTADRTAVGCACLPGQVADCYGGAPETSGVGRCTPGRTRCISGNFGLCVGSVAPQGERCNGIDDDCDGLVDDGVRSPCGGCDALCTGGVWGEVDAPFEVATPLARTREGWLTLARTRTLAGTIWVANSGEDTVSRIDAATATETARYASGGPSPSRVAVDYLGDVYVANRAFEAQSTLTKIAGAPTRCVDRDRDGRITTSTGPSDVRAPGDDECVLFTVDVGAPGELARALAIDGALGPDGEGGGDAWVGLHEGRAVLHVDGRDGRIVERIETPSFSPYGAAFDAFGTLYLISRDGKLARIDRRVRPRLAVIEEVPLPCYLLYSVAIDDDGRVLTTGFSCDQVALYDPRLDRWSTRSTEPSPRGAIVTGGVGYVAHTDGRLTRLRMDTLSVRDVRGLDALGTAPIESIGVAADGLGNIWVVSERGASADRGVATRVDANGLVTAHVIVGVAPHTQGDLAGAELRGGFAPSGETTRVFEGCAPNATQWGALHVVTDPGAEGRVVVSVRRAADRASLAAASFVDVATYPGSNERTELTLPDDGVVEVRLALTTPALDGAPRVQRVGLEWRCPGPG